VFEIAEILNINSSNISFSDNLITIKNYCEKHSEFEITQNLFHQRWHKYDKKICTKCYPIQKQISGCENEIKDFINSLNVVQENNNKKILINRFEIDIYIPENKIGIEFNGLYWHSDIYKHKNYHLNKTEECEKQGILLLHVFENEWLFRKKIVKSVIKSKLGLCDDKIYGRKCVVREIDTQSSKNFLDKNHLQGTVNSKINIGLFHDDKLVSVMTFGKKRFALSSENSDNEYEMLRFCNKLNTVVIGGADKLLKHFIRTHQPKSILTFADRRYSNGNLYKQLGFKYLGNTEPNYWYFKKNELMTHHCFNYRKDVLVKDGFNSDMRENEIMQERDYHRIYDCGSMKFELNL
jgi:hypothetical protein